MLESRLENEIDTNFAIFGHENDRKRKETEVSSVATNSYLYTGEFLYSKL